MKTYLIHARSLVAGAILAAASGGWASGATIAGQIGFTGTVTLNAPLATATSFTLFSNVEVDTGTGDFAVPSPVPAGTAVTIVAFAFEPFNAPVDPLWSFSVGEIDYEFALHTVSVARTTIGGSSFLSLSGTGTARITGFEDTPADFTFSAQQAVGAVGSTVSFSIENVVMIPEPGVAHLAWLGALAVGTIRRRRA